MFVAPAGGHLHEPFLRGFDPKREAWEQVSSQVNTKDQYHRKEEGDRHENEKDERHELCEIRGEDEGDHLPEVPENGSAIFDPLDDGCEIIL